MRYEISIVIEEKSDLGIDSLVCNDVQNFLRALANPDSYARELIINSLNTRYNIGISVYPQKPPTVQYASSIVGGAGCSSDTQENQTRHLYAQQKINKPY